MSRRKLIIMCASLLFMLGLLLTPGLFSATAHAKPLDPPRICPKVIGKGDGDAPGSTNGPVHKLQNDLNKWYEWYSSSAGVKYYQQQHADHPDFSKDFKLTVDGDFGPKTEQAVKDYQSLHKDRNGAQLAKDGIVGTLTWGALGECHS
jgi:peptidoglycan hydrolase-like protein with peptidoglycan-binding domain